MGGFLVTGSVLVTMPALAGDTDASAGAALDEIDVVSRHLDEARSSIETQIGASVYTIDAASLAAMPGGENGLLNQAILQAPDVSQDSFGQYHVRGEHNGLQYRINGIILPEGVSLFGQSLDPRLISSLQIITGALPPEYGLRTAGIIDITTKVGLNRPEGAVSLYGGSHGTVEPSVVYGGASGSYRYFASADALRSDLGIESPDGSSNPLHDTTRQEHGFLYLERILDARNRVSLVASLAGEGFQIPDRQGLTAPAGSPGSNGGAALFNSASLNETQRETSQFLVIGWQFSGEQWDLQHAATVRNSSLRFVPDPTGDLLFNGISQNAFRRNIAIDLQGDASYHLNSRHTLRAGWYVQLDRSTSVTNSQVVQQSTGSLVTIFDADTESEHIESAYVQDQWDLLPNLTLNYGLRFDTFSAFATGSQLSPRINLVWNPAHGTVVHAGYARYMTPPPFELISKGLLSRFAGTSGPGGGQPGPFEPEDTTPQAERAHYLDLGVLRRLSESWSLNLDSYYKKSTNLLDEGQFGAPIILTPFNYQYGRQYGLEASLSYAGRQLSAYANMAWQGARGRNIVSSQFNFSPEDLAYIATHDIDLDHEQKFTASGGMTYRHRKSSLSADFLMGSGMRADLFLPGGANIPNGMHLPYYTQINFGASHQYELGRPGQSLTVRVDLINALDRVYQIRNGTGVGVGAPQYGPRRGFFIGLSKSI
jgi:outer membrane receptor protein involved in Fe transport